MKYISSFFNPYLGPGGPANFEEKFLREFCWIHDQNFTIYDSEKEEWEIFEVSKMSKSKHAFGQNDPHPHIRKFLNDTGNEDTVFDMFLNGQFRAGVMNPHMGYCEKLNGVIKHDKWTKGTSHHISHTYSTYIQSPFNSCMFISYDGGSHDGEFIWGWIDESGKIRDLRSEKYQLSVEYATVGTCKKGFLDKTTNIYLDLAGKMMGLAAYGEIDKKVVSGFVEAFHNPPETPYSPDSPEIPMEERRDFMRKHGENRYYAMSRAHTEYTSNAKLSVRNEKGFIDLVACVQLGFETFMVNFLKDKEEVLKRTNHRLIISGGSALNVLTNEKIKNAYGLEVFVSPNPGDDCHSFGTLAKFLISDKQIWNLKTRANIAFRGQPLIETPQEIENVISVNGAKPVSHKEIVKLLEDGKILGMIIGRSEVGPRALGHRSILCDPSFPDMKDTLNEKVKFREWFRPFAPMCRKEDAPKYFDSHNFENMEYMSFAPLVKPEYRKKLPAITHEDGSARLQTIDKFNEDLDDIYKILSLKRKHKVLLNTSFNIQGKPILNSLSDALWMLDNTGLDHVIIKHNGTFFKFG